MSEQIPLLDVPPNRTKLEIWKERYRVVASKTDITHSPNQAWVAGLIGEEDSEFDRLGADEESACFAVAQVLKLPWLESVKLQAGVETTDKSTPPTHPAAPPSRFSEPEATLPTPSANLGDSERLAETGMDPFEKLRLIVESFCQQWCDGSGSYEGPQHDFEGNEIGMENVQCRGCVACDPRIGLLATEADAAIKEGSDYLARLQSDYTALEVDRNTLRDDMDDAKKKATLVDWVDRFIHGDDSISICEEDGGVIVSVNTDKVQNNYVGGTVAEALTEAIEGEDAAIQASRERGQG